MTPLLDHPVRSDASRAKFRVCDQVTDEEWQRIADRCPHATFFHTPRWHRLFEDVYPNLKAITKRFEFSDGTVAIFPLLERRQILRLAKSYLSSAAGCYGGWISEEALLPEQIAALAQWILQSCTNLFWRLNPFEPGIEILTPYATVQDATEILDLRPFEDTQALRQHYRHSVRKQINKGCKAGLEAATAETWEEWERYFAIYQGRLTQWGTGATSRYPIELFRRLFEARGSNVKLWIASQNAAIIGGNLNFYHGRHCVEWHAAYDPNYYSTGVRDFLVDSIIENARSSGYALYDFNPSGGHEGSLKFKQTFGTSSFRSDIIVRRSGLLRIDALRKAYRTVRRMTQSP
jgi:hypothetical protein